MNEQAQYYVDLGRAPPEDILADLGMVYIMFTRLEYMVLIAIKRLRRLNLTEAQELYAGYSLGAKLHGKTPCRVTGAECPAGKTEPGLIELAKGIPQVRQIATRISEVVSLRNTYAHGLITTATYDSAYSITKLSHSGRAWEQDKYRLYAIKDELSYLIEELNEALPVPGVHTSLVSGMGEIDVSFTQEALAEYGIHMEEHSDSRE